ncbi:MAG TPA: ATP-binding cassette domain-containing protein [Polyangia bacterium]|jgi:polar amino acid transport system ATP-binding protein/sulfate transport system ATP-binding protein
MAGTEPVTTAAAAAAPAPIVLTVKDVALQLGGVQILDRVSFEVVDRTRPGIVTGQVVGVLGPSGVGKTRLLRIIAGLDPPDAGSVAGVGGRPVEAGHVGFVFQNYPLLRHRTVQQNLEIAGRANGLARGEARDRALVLLKSFKLAERARYYPALLSGGERQRVAIAQQLVKPKQLLLMDEPFSGLDPATLDDVIRLIIEVANMDDLNTILVVTHDIRAALIASDTLLVLGRERTPEGKAVPGARIRDSYDLVARGLAWQAQVERLPAFAPLEHEIRERFARL